MTPAPARFAHRAFRRWAVMLSALAVALLGITAPASGADAVGSFAGRVTDGTGAGIEGILVEPLDADYNPIGVGASTDVDGYYQVDGVPAGESYVVGFWGWSRGYCDQYFDGAAEVADAQGVPITAGSVLQGVNAVMVQGGTISGTVTHAATGDPVAGVTVYAYGSTGSTATGTTDEFGGYEIATLRPGDYTVWFDGSAVGLASHWYDGVYEESTATIIPVTEGGSFGANAMLDVPAEITGRVTNQAGAGIAGVAVSAAGLDGSSGGVATTDVSGYYTLENMPQGEYHIWFDARDQGYVLEYYADVLDISAATPVMAVEGAVTAAIDAVLAVGGAISGTVTGPGGAPADNVTVWAYGTGPEGSGYAVTDAAGHYAMTGLLPGEYLVMFSGAEAGLTTEYYDNAASYIDAHPVTVTASATTTGINGSLIASGAVAGTVTGPTGPVEGVYVVARDAMGVGVGGHTAEDGTYLIEGLTPGSYTVRFEGSGVGLIDEYYDDALLQSDADPVAVASGGTTSGIDATLVTGGSISGTVSGPDGPVVGAWVYISSATGWWEATTDADGMYRVGGLATGTYEVYFDADALGLVSEYYDDAQSAEDATEVAVTAPSNVTGVDAVLAEGATISGTVTGPGGPVEGVWVGALGPDGVAAAYDQTDEDGHYTLDALAAGTYTVSFQASNVGLVSEYYDDALTLATADPIVLSVGMDVVGINAVLDEGGSISGTVTGPTGPVADVYVIATGRDGVGHGTAYTEADGTYVIRGLAADDYEVSFWPDDASVRSEYYDDQLSARDADLVPVAEDQDVAGIDAVLLSSSVPLFWDVTMAHPFNAEIEWLAGSGITTGYADGSFHPSAPVARQAMAAFLYRLAGEPEFTPPATPTFVDVPRSHPFFKEIEWLAETEITTGWADHTFRPGASVARQAMAAFLYRFAGEPAFTDPATATFVDVPTSSPFFTEVEWLASTKITTGWPDRTFRPTTSVARQAMAAFLMRFEQWRYA